MLFRSPESYADLVDPKRPKSFAFRPGMNASADIQTRTKDNVLSVPINAVTTREKNSDNVAKNTSDEQVTEGNQEEAKAGLSEDLDEVVFLLKADGTVKKIKVRTDIQDINYIEVLSGLSEGDKVVTAPYSVIKIGRAHV